MLGCTAVTVSGCGPGEMSQELLLNCSDLGDQAGDAEELFETLHPCTFVFDVAALRDVKKNLSCGSFFN